MGEGGGADRGSLRGLNGEGERFGILIFCKTPEISALVLRIQNIPYLLLIATADPEKDGKSDEGNATETSHDTTDDGADDGRRVCAPSKPDIISLIIIVVPDSNDPGNCQ